MRHPLLDRLRNETSHLHQSLEDGLQLLRPDMSLAEYRKLLERFYGFYAPWEAAVGPAIAHLLPHFFDERRKTPLLERDLRFLQSDISKLPLCPDLPDTCSQEGILGTLYVLEGATLGGQLLTRHFIQQFPVSTEEGCAFFSSYGSAVGERWRAFCTRLGDFSAPSVDDDIIASANRTFRFLGSWLGAEMPKTNLSSSSFQ